MKCFFIAVAVAVALTPVLAASDYYKTLYRAKTLRADKQFSEALEIIIPLAKENNPDAQIILADMYFRAEGLNQDNNRALYWACSALSAGDYQAQKFRLKLALRTISESYQPPQCSELLDD